MEPIKISFKSRGVLFRHRHLEIRQTGKQIRFYEVDSMVNKEYCLPRDTVKYLVRKRILPRLDVLKRALKRDQTIFQENAKIKQL